MLGDLIGEETGEITGMRVLSTDGGHAVLEASFRASGTLLDVEGNDMGTYESVMRADGTLFGEGQGVTMTRDGESVTWHGSGIGHVTESGGVSWRGSIFWESAASRFTQLNGTAGVFEFEQDEGGKVTAKVYEWK
ncbi:hypothetical protein Q5762_30330 [Streptomyces sp. P9(2023)]|uniref:hypothetical protein n=1 Tax=Streptomyces sp. P9(2023) TaxID=3064394 RepID=UPI0028F4541A|nr:hypothetical protein [Streptomyces sp. P9(2023)]MDT9692552.1 hypothetical protein [Streptomyces sp. P9(2023)]